MRSRRNHSRCRQFVRRKGARSCAVSGPKRNSLEPAGDQWTEVGGQEVSSESFRERDGVRRASVEALWETAKAETTPRNGQDAGKRRSASRLRRRNSRRPNSGETPR